MADYETRSSFFMRRDEAPEETDAQIMARLRKRSKRRSYIRKAYKDYEDWKAASLKREGDPIPDEY